MKWIKWLVIIAVVLVVVVLGAVFYFKDALIRHAVITGGDTVLGQGTTKLDSVNLSLFGGSLSMRGLSLDNPDEFRQPHFFELDGTDVSVSLGSVMSDKVVVPTVNLDGLHVIAETSLEQGLPKLNLITIKKTVDASIGGTAEPAPSDPDAEGKKIVIQKLNVTNMQVTGAATMPGGASVPLNFTVRDFVIEGIGEKENGVVMKEVIAIVLDAILRKAIEGVKDQGGINLGSFEGGAEALKNLDVLKGIDISDEGTTKALEGILGGSKSDDAEGGEKSGGIGGMLNKIGGSKEKTDEETNP